MQAFNTFQFTPDFEKKPYSLFAAVGLQRKLSKQMSVSGITAIAFDIASRIPSDSLGVLDAGTVNLKQP